jgi:transcription initiation factor TFIID subunit 6
MSSGEDLDRVPPSSVASIATSVGVESLPDEVARALASDAEYRLREVIQDAVKFMRHSKRSKLSTEDVNSSLQLRDVEPLYGFPAGSGPIAFREVPNHPELFYQEQRELELKDILATKLPKPPVAVNVVPHWLAVEGVQPLIPENPPPRADRSLRPALDASRRVQQFRAPVAPAEVRGPPAAGAKRPRDEAREGAAAGGGGAVGGGQGAGGGAGVAKLVPVVAHELSKELQLYFDRITATVRGGGVGGEAPLLRAALESLATDAGLHALLPYLVQFVQEEVACGLRDVPKLRALVGVVDSLARNESAKIELYLHQLMPPVVTCMVAKKLGAKGEDAHWGLRLKAAETMATVCEVFGERYPTIQPRVTKTLTRAMLDAAKPAATRFGAVAGIAALGTRVVRALILPNLKAILETLEEPEEDEEAEGKETNERGASEEDGPSREKGPSRADLRRRRREEARRCRDALTRAVGACLRDALVAPRRRAREVAEPERRAARQKQSMRGTGTGPGGAEALLEAADGSTPAAASAVKGWTVGKAPGTLRVSTEGGIVEVATAPGGVDGGEGDLDAEEPERVAARVAAAAALLGDCVVPYASVDPVVSDAFL